MAGKMTGLGRGLDGLFPSYPGRGRGKAESAGDAQKTMTPSQEATLYKEEKTPAKEVKAERKTAKKGSDRPRSAASGQNALSLKGMEQAENPAADIDADAVPEKKTVREPLMVRLSEVEPNREQPRKVFAEEGLNQLAESIKVHGVIQPLIVQKRDHSYEIIAGERRWRAARMAGLKEVPVVIKDYTDKEILEVSLIENIQREDLNPVEEAKAYQRLLTEYELKQDEVAQRVSKSRTTITNSLRLLKLDERVLSMLSDNEISAGHARALLPLEDGEAQYTLSCRIAKQHLSVRETEREVKKLLHPPKNKEPKAEISQALAAIYADMEEKLKSSLGTKVTLNHTDAQKGKIEIEYYSNEELERIFDLLHRI